MATRKERWEFKVGSPVMALDDMVGQLRQVILNPGDGRVTALVVRQLGIPIRDYVVPVDAVEYTANDGIQLKLSAREVEKLPLLQQARYLAPSSSVGGYDKSQVLYPLQGGPRGKQESSEGRTSSSPIAIRAGQRVVATDGEVGKVDVVLVDSATKQATHFTVRKGLLFHKDIMVPVGWIAEWQPDVIKLGVDKEALEHLPAYRPDQELQWEVEDALWDDSFMVEGVLYESDISVSARDGVITLRGNVRNKAQKEYAANVAAKVPGVLSVNNLLAADDEIERAVAEALNSDPRTRNLQIHVDSWFGYVHLSGDVPTKEAKAAAVQVASSVPGVKTAVSVLEVEDVPTALENERLREIATGQPVYTHDETIGRVEKLLMDPETWRLTAIVVRTKRRRNARDGQPGQPKGEELIVVPVEHVLRATVGSVYLSLTEEQINNLPRFNPAEHPAPSKDWRPPAPYRREDIAVDLSHSPMRAH